MLFVSNAPIQVDICDDRKVIVLLPNKIMFSHLDFIEEYLSMPLITTRPIRMCYESSVMQTMVVSQTTVEVYYCDWKTQIKLIRVIILNNESVQNFYYQKQTGWHIFGSMKQYEPTKISFHKSQEHKNTKILAKCYINKNKYLLSQNKLEKSHRGQEIKEVLWKDRMMVLRNCNFQIEMFGSSTLDKRRDILCINEAYVLIVNGYEVLVTIIEPTVAYCENNLLVSYVQKGTLTTVQKYQNNAFVEIGTIGRLDGNLVAAFLYEDNLMLLQYEEKEIHLKSIPLVTPTDEPSPVKKNTTRRKRLLQSISRILQQSHEQGSQFFTTNPNGQVPKNQSLSFHQKGQSDYHPSSKPIVRDIAIDDEEIKDDSLKQGDSEVLSRSGVDGTDDSPQKQIDDKDEQVSFEVQKQRKKVKKMRKRGSLAEKYLNKNGEPSSPQLFQSQNIRQKSKNNQNSFNDETQQELNPKNSKKAVRNSSLKTKNQAEHNNSNLSNHSNQNHSYDEHVQTPGFGFEGGFGAADERWTTTLDKQWNQAAHNEISQQVQDDLEESVCIQDADKSILKFVPEQLSLKVEKFKPEHGMLTAEIYNKIEKSSYCSLITKAIEEDPDRLEELMELFLPEVINEPEAPLFFEKSIRTFNPQFTQDKIRKLFKSIIDRNDLKEKMTAALQLFKLSQVPKELLCFPQDFIKIMNILYKEVYIQDLLKPSQSTIEYLLQSYFSIKNFSEEVIKIEDEQIDITHPRNMLNVLLYLNEVFGLKIEIIIKVYCSKLLAEDYLDILKKITVKQNIFQICEVPRSVLDEVVIQRFNQLLNQSVDNAEYLWNVIEFLSEAVIDEYRIRLAVINEFNKYSIDFDLPSFIKIKQSNVDIFTFLEKIINENSCRNLINLKIQSIYRSLYWLQENQKITYATNEYIELIKSLAEKFCQKKYFFHAFKLLETVIPRVKASFVAKLLYENLNCKFLNRLAECVGNKIESLKTLFPEITSNSELDLDTLEADKIKIPHFSNSFSCSWKKYTSILQEYFDAPMELKVLIFLQINIANQLFLMLDENMKRKFQSFLTEIQENIIGEIDDINRNDDSINPKGLTSIRFENTTKNELQSQLATSTMNRDDVLLMHDDHEFNKKNIVYKSMTLIDHYNEVSGQKLIRRNSAEKDRDPKLMTNDSDLMRVRLLVSKNQIIEELRQIYEKKSQETFIQSLQLVDLEKIQFCHLDLFKAIVNKQIEFPLSRLLPFEIFLTPQPSQAFQNARSKIKSQITLANFWIIYTIIQLMFQMGNEICKIFIQKCIMYFRTDDFHAPIQQIMRRMKPKMDSTFIDRMIESARDYNLVRICSILKQKVY